jgi:Flp pilus assembly pilin Flp
MITFIKCFLAEERGQDLIEYTLLLAFVALTSATLFAGVGRSVKGIWSTVNSQLVAANSAGS